MSLARQRGLAQHANHGMCGASMTEPVSTARYFPWNGGAVFVGTAGALPAHAHQAIQICFLFEGRILLRTSNDDPWTDYDIAIVPSQHRHGMNGSKIHYGATIFIEPETREGRILAERYPQNAIAEIDRTPVATMPSDLQTAVLAGRGQQAIVELARRVVQSLTQHSEPSVTSDERVMRAVRYVNEHLSASLTLQQVARVAYLSPSRFRHLFAAQTGMGLRQYILWRRLVHVWEHRMNGASLSTAAHAAAARPTLTADNLSGIRRSDTRCGAASDRIALSFNSTREPSATLSAHFKPLPIGERHERSDEEYVCLQALPRPELQMRMPEYPDEDRLHLRPAVPLRGHMLQDQRVGRNARQLKGCRALNPRS